MKVLAIDTSFDDTAVAIVEGTTILSNVLSTDLSIHQEFGGVVPRLAREAHEKNIDHVIALSLKRAYTAWEQIGAIAVTQGPGLSICLEIGIAKAKELAEKYQKPLIPINHMEGHLLSFLCQPKKRKNNNWIPDNAPNRRLYRDDKEVFPLLGVLISGGNTQFVYGEKIGSYKIIGQTKDDAMGEAYDKVGRMLGLGYPAGATLEKMAQKGIPGNVIFPVPMRQIKSADTSYSGLKTAAMRIVSEMKKKREEETGTPLLSQTDIADIALGFQTAAITHLTEKLEFAIASLKSQPKASLAVGGGVICNSAVKKALRKIAKKHTLRIYFPYSKKLCTDNAAMIGVVAQFYIGVDDKDFDRKPLFPLQEMLL